MIEGLLLRVVLPWFVSLLIVINGPLPLSSSKKSSSVWFGEDEIKNSREILRESPPPLLAPLFFLASTYLYLPPYFPPISVWRVKLRFDQTLHPKTKIDL